MSYIFIISYMLTIELGQKYSAMYSWIEILSIIGVKKEKKEKSLNVIERLFPKWINFLLFMICHQCYI